jgi:membrane associated rhomboid family serine protease
MYESSSPYYSQPTKNSFPWVTWLLVASTVGVFLLQLCEPQTGGDDTIARTFSFSPQKWAGNEWWTVLTYAWVHDLAPFGKPDLFWAHIVFNMIPLICMGPPLEELIGHFSFLLLYLGGAVAAALAWMYLTTSVQTDPQIIGASGAVFAVIAALGTAGPGTRVTFFFLPFLPLQMSAGVVAVFACIVEVLSLPFHSGVAHMAHVGGAIFGFLYVLIFHLILGRSYLSN